MTTNRKFKIYLLFEKPDNGPITVLSGWHSTKIMNGFQLLTSNIPRISCVIFTYNTLTSQDHLSNWIIGSTLRKKGLTIMKKGLTIMKTSTMIRKCQLG